MAAYTAIDDPEAYFQTVIYTGDGSANHAITLGADTDMQPDLVWIKNRDATDSHCLFDSVRGATKLLSTDADAAETTDTDTLDSFASDGFQVDADVKVNTNTEKYVAWCWKESATSGVDIVSYTGNGTDDTDISHNLSAVPKMIIVKNRDTTDAWQVYHGANTSAPETDYLVLNDTAATADAVDRWSDEAPTSSVFTLGDGAEVNTNTENYIAYCFAEKQGFSKFGSYIGNGNTANNTFVYTGFKVGWVLIKRSSSSGEGWFIFDSTRSPANLNVNELRADTNSAETTGSHYIDFLSNGFKPKTNGAGIGGSGDTYIYMAFAEAPFVNSNGVPCNAR